MSLQFSNPVRGNWWTPGNEGNPASGELLLREDGTLTLTLDSVMADWFAGDVDLSALNMEVPLIYGTIRANATKITLLKCIVGAFGINSVVPIYEVPIYGNMILEGTHLENIESECVKSATVQIGFLDSLTDQNIISFNRIDHGKEHDDTPIGTFRNDHRIAAILDGAEVSLIPRIHQVFQKTVDGRSLIVADYWLLYYKFTEPCSINSLLSQVREIQDLVTFIVGLPAGLGQVQVNHSEEHHPNFELLSQSPAKHNPREALTLAVAPLLKPNEIDFACLINNWHQNYAALDPIIQHLVNRIYYPHAPIQNHVVAVVATAELLYSRLGMEEKRYTPEEFKKIRDVIGAAIQADSEIASLIDIQEVVQNRKTLDQRLTSLVKELGDEIETSLFRKGFTKWKSGIKKARNDLAHKGTTEQFSTDKLRVLADVMGAILTLNVLMKVSPSLPALLSALERRYQNLPDRINHHFPVNDD